MNNFNFLSLNCCAVQVCYFFGKVMNCYLRSHLGQSSDSGQDVQNIVSDFVLFVLATFELVWFETSYLLYVHRRRLRYKW